MVLEAARDARFPQEHINVETLTGEVTPSYNLLP